MKIKQRKQLATRVTRIWERPTLTGFTLVELLVVIAIIGLLAAVLLPTLVRAKGKTYRVQCATNLHQLSLGLNGFVADNRVYPLFGLWIYALSTEGCGVDYTKGVWRCPSCRWYADKLPPRWVAPSYSYNGYGLFSDGRVYTLGLDGLGAYTTEEYGGQLYGPPVRESEVARPDDMMAMGDALGPGNLFRREDLDHVEFYGNAAERHTGKANVVFCDGHVESPTLKFLDLDTSEAALARWNRDHQPHQELLAP